MVSVSLLQVRIKNIGSIHQVGKEQSAGIRFLRNSIMAIEASRFNYPTLLPPADATTPSSLLHPQVLPSSYQRTAL